MSTDKTTFSEFLKAFPIPLHHKGCSLDCRPSWVFWRKCEGCGNESSSADLGDPVIHGTIISVFSNMEINRRGFLVQFWAPVTIGGSRVLSTSAQPFAVPCLDKELGKYRVYSAEYKYNIDENYKSDNEVGDHMIINGGPATAFLNRLPYIYDLQWIPSAEDIVCFNLSIMLPVCFSSQRHCIGVLEITRDTTYTPLGCRILDVIKKLKEVGMDVCRAEESIPSKTINGFKPIKNKIEEALKVVCASHNLALAQVWISYEETRTKALKLGGYLHAVKEKQYDADFERYYNLCDAIPQGTGHELALKTLHDYKSRYLSKLRHDILMDWECIFTEKSALVICLRSNETGDFDYVFEFVWTKRPDSNHVSWLENILLTVKRCLPSFKFASGEELGDKLKVIIDAEMPADTNTSNFKIFRGKKSSPLPKELEKDAELGADLNVIADAETSANSETSNSMIFQGQTSSPLPKELEKGKKPNEGKCKTSLIQLPPEAIKQQFGKTMKEAAENLNVSLSTLKRKFKELGMLEWPGPPKSRKRKENSSSIIQINTNENSSILQINTNENSSILQINTNENSSITQINTNEEDDNGAIHDVSTVNVNNITLIIKAEYAGDMYKICLPALEASFVTVKEKIGMKLKLSVGTYKLKYLDEDEDWITLTSDEDLDDCIKSSGKSDRVVIRLRVLPCQQQTEGPNLLQYAKILR